MDDEFRDKILLDYGHSGRYSEKPSAAPSWCLLGFALAGIPIFIIGAHLYDIDTIVAAMHAGVSLAPGHNFWALAFFGLLVLLGAVGIIRFRKSPPPVRFVLLGFMAGLGLLGLVEGLCFGWR